MLNQPAPETIPRGAERVVLARRLLRVAWMSILLGVGVESILVILSATFGANGLAVAVLFGGSIVAYTLGSATPLPEIGKVVTLFANELIYPVGCAVILFSAGALGARLGDETSANS